MALSDEPWRRKMLVQNIPEEWSQDMLENFIEVVTKAELEEYGVERFCGVKHTALMTFKQPLTEEEIQSAETRSTQRKKHLHFSLIPAAPAAVLAMDIGSSVTSKNLLSYFESSQRAVKTCVMYPRKNMAVVTFNNAEDAAAVLAVREHNPSKGTSIIVEACYEQFHTKILNDLTSSQTTPMSDNTVEDGQASSQPCSPADSVHHKPSAVIMPQMCDASQKSDNSTSRIENESCQSNQAMGKDGDYLKTAFQYKRGGERRKRRHRPHGKRGQYRLSESVNQPERSQGNEEQQRPSRRFPFGYNQKRGRVYYSKRGRSYGQREVLTRQPGEGELYSSGPAHTPSPTLSAASKQTVLDADCNPVSLGSSNKSVFNADTVASWSEDDNEMQEGDDDSDSSDASLEDIDLQVDSLQHSPATQQNTQKLAVELTTPRPSANLPFLEQHRSEVPLKSVPVPRAAAHPVTECGMETRPLPQNKSQLQLESEVEAEQLKFEKMKLEKELQKKDQELEKMKQEKEELKNRRKETMNFPSYQLRLMQEFAQSCALCEISIHEKDGTVEFYGTGENFETAKCAFMFTLQDTAEDSLSISPALAGILHTIQGQLYLSQVGETYGNCSFDVQDSRLVCAAFYMNCVQMVLGELKRNIYEEKIKVSKAVMPQLQILKQQLEHDFPLAHITLPNDTGSEVVVEGINGDFDLVLRELRDLCSRNQPGKGVFQIQGLLETKACRQWCTQELDDVKTLILKNSGDCKPLDDPSQVGFVYQCHKDVLAQVQHKLDNIRKLTRVSKVNLQNELRRYSERALVINGMHSMGIEPFSRLLEGKLKKEGGWDAIIHFNLPAKCSLPKFAYKLTKHSRPRPHPAARRHRIEGHRHRHHGSAAIRPFHTTVGSSSLTIKSGDIVSEKVDGMVCVVGEDMDLNQTAVGQAIVKKYPHAQSNQKRTERLTPYPQTASLPVPQGGGYKAGQVITKAMQPSSPFGVVQGVVQDYSQQEPNTLYLAVLSKLPQQQISAQVKTLVQKCLQSAVQQGNRSIAFPPLGMGKKFQFPLDTVVNAMVITAYQFLQSNPRSLQSVTFVIFDVGVARQFREAAKKIIEPARPAVFGSPQAGDSASNEDEDDDADDSDDADNSGGGNYFIGASNIPESAGDAPFDFFTFSGDNSGDEGKFSPPGGRTLAASDDDDELTFFHLDDEDQRDSRSFTQMALTSTSSDSFEAHMCLRSQNDFSAVKLGLLQELRSMFIHEDRLTDLRTFKKLGTRVMEEIKNAAARRGVVFSFQTIGGKEVLIARGQKGEVAEMMALIKDKQHIFLQKENREPRVGSLPSASRRIQLPRYWKVCQDNLFKDLEQFFREHRTYGKLYTMGSAEVKEVDSLIQKTWVPHLVGAGKDARNLGHKGLKVVKLERLENPNLWEEYCTHRERLIRRMKQQPSLPLEKVKGSSGPPKTTSNIARHGLLNREMYPQVNEHYLFHGTKKEYIQAIHDQGLDTRIASERAMLGRGVYAAESATKADQYTDDKASRTSGNKTMILMRVLLGEPFINTKSDPTKYSRPPCKRCYKDKCTCQGGAFFDSVIDDAHRNFREFVIYDRSMCYPEYFITYQRI